MSENKSLGHNSKKDFLKDPVEHIDITSFDARKIISSMEKMSFVSRETANAANIYNEMLKDKECTIFLTLASFSNFFIFLTSFFRCGGSSPVSLNLSWAAFAWDADRASFLSLDISFIFFLKLGPAGYSPSFPFTP